MTEPQDFFEQISAEAVEAIPGILALLRGAVESGTRRPVRHNCIACGANNDVQVPTLDVGATTKLLEAYSSILLRYQEARRKDGDDTSRKANAILRDIADLPSEDLAEELARVERELAALSE